MDRETFRRDRWLRTSGYHLATWSLVLLALEMRRATDASSVGAAAVVIAATVLVSLTHERRIGKMCGPAGDVVSGGAGLMWLVAFSIAILASLGTAMLGRSDQLVPIWMTIVGATMAIWGSALRFSWYVAFGAAIAAAALVDVALPEAGVRQTWRVFVLGAVVPAGAVFTNWRWLWFR